jgi:murein DD-endopeptidase MepM/ murein hydrolase activator NlpD
MGPRSLTMYPLLALIFFATLIAGILLIVTFMTKFRYHPYWRRAGKAYAVWLILYSLFIALGTGPVEKRLYEPSVSSPYKLPWKSGAAHFVSQGNRSFTSHRDQHLYAWDFWMPIGTQVLAARGGVVLEIEENFDGIGLHSNFISISHIDGTRAMYAHILKNGSVVRPGDRVEQGQLIAYSGMVGQTINPHLHFVVLDKEGTTSLPITFSDVRGGVPYAGRFYPSSNEALNL